MYTPQESQKKRERGREIIWRKFPKFEEKTKLYKFKKLSDLEEDKSRDTHQDTL